MWVRCILKEDKPSILGSEIGPNRTHNVSRLSIIINQYNNTCLTAGIITGQAAVGKWCAQP